MLSRSVSNAVYHDRMIGVFILVWSRDCFLQPQQSLSQRRDTRTISGQLKARDMSYMKPTQSASEVELAVQGVHAYTLLPHRRSLNIEAAYHIVPAVIPSANDQTSSSIKDKKAYLSRMAQVTLNSLSISFLSMHIDPPKIM